MKAKMGVEVKLYSLTSMLDGSEWTKPCPGRCILRKGTSSHCTGSWVGPTAGLDMCRKSRPPPGFDFRTVQLVPKPTTLFQTTKHTIRVHNSGPKI